MAEFQEVELTNGETVRVYRSPTQRILAMVEAKDPEPVVPIVTETNVTGRSISMSVPTDPDYVQALKEWNERKPGRDDEIERTLRSKSGKRRAFSTLTGHPARARWGASLTTSNGSSWAIQSTPTAFRTPAQTSPASTCRRYKPSRRPFEIKWKGQPIEAVLASSRTKGELTYSFKCLICDLALEMGLSEEEWYSRYDMSQRAQLVASYRSRLDRQSVMSIGLQQ